VTPDELKAACADMPVGQVVMVTFTFDAPPLGKRRCARIEAPLDSRSRLHFVLLDPDTLEEDAPHMLFTADKFDRIERVERS
jgi:hypothetical protein